MTLFGLDLNMTVSLAGALPGVTASWTASRGSGSGWVYSPMPPVAQQVITPVPLEPVREF